MSEAMTFPETVEEFMEQYKIVDKEQVYTNGAELIPIFRMKQWFDHLEDAVHVVRCGECIHLTHDNIAPGWRRRCELWGDGKEESWFCADGEKVSE